MNLKGGVAVIGGLPAAATTATSKGVTIEEAIGIIDRSWFHITVLLVTGWITGAVAMEISTPSFLIPSAAACDLKMSPYDKGLFGSIAFAGMVCGAQFWGVTADLLGRRFVLRLVMLCNGCLGIITSLLPSLPLVLTARFFSGFFIASGSACSATFLGEFHREDYRARAIVRLALFPGTATCLLAGRFDIEGISGLLLFLLAGLAYGIFSLSWEVPLPWVTFTPWRFFVICCSLPCLLGGLAISWFPESPRFLVSRGRHDEALEVLSRIWSYSSKRPPSEYPVKALYTQTPEKVSVLKMLSNQTVPLFCHPYLKNTLLLCFSIFSVIACINGLMVWYPEIFNRMEQYAALNPGKAVTACTAIDYMLKNASALSHGNGDVVVGNDHGCITDLQPKAFLRTAVINFFDGLVPVLGIFIVRWLGNKRLLNFCIITGSILMAVGMNLVRGEIGVMAMATTVSAVISICITLSLGISVDIYPTHLRAFGASTAILCGRFGALCGSLLVAALLPLYCPAVFWAFSCLLFDVQARAKNGGVGEAIFGNSLGGSLAAMFGSFPQVVH